MEIKILNISKRRAVFELQNESPYYSEVEYELLLNNSSIKNIKRNVFLVENLEPNNEYQLQLREVGKTDICAEQKFKTEIEYVRLNVRKFGAKGTGEVDDTLAIQAAIMACPENSSVYIPKGTYSVTSIFLKSDITVELADEAVIKGIEDREKYPILPGFTETTDETEEYYLGSWEGNPLNSYSSIITGINVKNVKFVGNGTINGNATHEGWWKNAKVKRGAWRPKTISLINCENVVFEGIKVMNSPAWTVHPSFSNELKFLNMEITNPHDSPNTDGIDPESCTNVEIIGVKISVGDDCIAIKSGKIYLGKKLKRATRNLSIRNCYMEHGHGAVVIGSEVAAGVNGVKIEQCIFYKTDKGLRIKTRRGRGKDSIISGIECKNIFMDEVESPFVLNAFYFCDPDGKSEYVGTQLPLTVDERTPEIKDLSFKNIECINAHITAGYLCGLPEKKVEKICLENVKITFSKEAKEGIPAMMNYCEKTKKQGFYLKNIENLCIKDLQIIGAEGLELITENVSNIKRD